MSVMRERRATAAPSRRARCATLLRAGACAAHIGAKDRLRRRLRNPRAKPLPQAGPRLANGPDMVAAQTLRCRPTPIDRLLDLHRSGELENPWRHLLHALEVPLSEGPTEAQLQAIVSRTTGAFSAADLVASLATLAELARQGSRERWIEVLAGAEIDAVSVSRAYGLRWIGADEAEALEPIVESMRAERRRLVAKVESMLDADADMNFEAILFGLLRDCEEHRRTASLI